MKSKCGNCAAFQPNDDGTGNCHGDWVVDAENTEEIKHCWQEEKE